MRWVDEMVKAVGPNRATIARHRRCGMIRRRKPIPKSGELSELQSGCRFVPHEFRQIIKKILYFCSVVKVTGKLGFVCQELRSPLPKWPIYKKLVLQKINKNMFTTVKRLWLTTFFSRYLSIRLHVFHHVLLTKGTTQGCYGMCKKKKQKTVELGYFGSTKNLSFVILGCVYGVVSSRNGSIGSSWARHGTCKAGFTSEHECEWGMWKRDKAECIHCSAFAVAAYKP